MRARKSGIEPDALLEELDDPLASDLRGIPQSPCEQIQPVSFDVLGRRYLPQGPRPVAHTDPEGLDDGSSQLILELENVREPPVVRLRPDVKSRVSLDELRRDPDAISCAAYTTLEQHSDAEFPGDLAYVDVAAFVGER